MPPSDAVALSVPHGVAIDAASLQKWLGITTNDAVFSVAWLSRDELGMAFLHNFGLLDSADLIVLSKGLSKIGARIFKFLWSKLRGTVGTTIISLSLSF